MRTEFGVDHVPGDTGDGDFERGVNGGSVCDSDLLPGGDDFYGIRAAGGGSRRRSRRRDRLAAGDDDGRVGRIGLEIPVEPASGFDVCNFVAGGAGIGGLQQQFAVGAEWGNAGGYVHIVVDDYIEWADADLE
jgi:hypothetical protein